MALSVTSLGHEQSLTTRHMAALRERHPKIQFMPASLKILVASVRGGIVHCQQADGSLRILALASTGAINAYGFRIKPSAWKGALPAFRRRPRMMAHHDWAWPIGRWDIRQEVTEEGLMLEGWITAAEPGIQQKVLDGTLEEVSVTFLPLAEEKEDGDVPTVTKAKLYEASLVSLGADPDQWIEPMSQRLIMPRHSPHDSRSEVVAALRATRDALREHRGAVVERVGRSRRMAELVETLAKGV